MYLATEFTQDNLCNEAIEPFDRIDAYLSSISPGMVDSDFVIGCPAGSLAQEMSVLSGLL